MVDVPIIVRVGDCVKGVTIWGKPNNLGHDILPIGSLVKHKTLLCKNCE